MVDNCLRLVMQGGLTVRSSDRSSCLSLRGRLCSKNACLSASEVRLFQGIHARLLPSIASFKMLKKDRDGIVLEAKSSPG